MKRNTIRRPQVAVRLVKAGLLSAVLLGFLPGCATLTNIAELRSIPVSGLQNPVVDYACIWQQGEGRDERGRPCRGFCGQLMFMTATSKKPAIVKGAVSIYVFDNVGTLEEQTKPVDTFHFTAEQWATFQRRINLGMSYQLFIPYSRPGSQDVDCQLHVKFTPEGATTPLYSHPETVHLKGSSGPSAVAAALDEKLTASSPLFGKGLSGKLPPNIDHSELLRKLQEDQSRAAAAKSGIHPRQPATAAPDRQRLQALLDQATNGSPVAQVGHEAPAGTTPSSQRVTQALHETTD